MGDWSNKRKSDRNKPSTSLRQNQVIAKMGSRLRSERFPPRRFGRLGSRCHPLILIEQLWKWWQGVSIGITYRVSQRNSFLAG